MGTAVSISFKHAPFRAQGGQSAIEYLILVTLLIGLTGYGWLGEGGGLLGWLLDALAGFHRRFAAALAMPL